MTERYVLASEVEKEIRTISTELGVAITQWAVRQEMREDQPALATVVMRVARERLRALLASAVELPKTGCDCGRYVDGEGNQIHFPPCPLAASPVEGKAPLTATVTQPHIPFVPDLVGWDKISDEAMHGVEGKAEAGELPNWPDPGYDPGCYWCRKFGHKELAEVTKCDLCHRHAMMELSSLRRTLARPVPDDKLKEAFEALAHEYEGDQVSRRIRQILRKEGA